MALCTFRVFSKPRSWGKHCEQCGNDFIVHIAAKNIERRECSARLEQLYDWFGRHIHTSRECNTSKEMWSLSEYINRCICNSTAPWKVYLIQEAKTAQFTWLNKHRVCYATDTRKNKWLYVFARATQFSNRFIVCEMIGLKNFKQMILLTRTHQVDCSRPGLLKKVVDSNWLNAKQICWLLACNP